MCMKCLTEELEEYPDYGPVLKMDGFDDAAVGTVHSADDDSLHIVYDYEKCLSVLMRDMDGMFDMSREEAIEYFEYNCMGSLRSLMQGAKKNVPVVMEGLKCYCPN